MVVSRTIFLIGFMGAGKTTFGKKLANRLECAFVDSDKEIEQMQGVSIEKVFEESGESYFRSLEQQWLQNFTASSPVVCSVGGGMPCFFDNMSQMKQKGMVIYLKHPPKQLVSRLLNAKSVRPILKDKNKIELEDFITNLLAERESFYLQADLIIESSNQKIDYVMEKLNYTK
jgi:shikimate kinase